MRFITILLLLVLASTSTATFFQASYRQKIPSPLNTVWPLKREQPPEKLATVVKQEILMPPPLTGPLARPAGQLTTTGILRETNQQRAKNKLADLIINEKLNQAAQAKVEDMFARQYFEHIAPDGTGPADLVSKTSYQFIRVGENLALGNYADDAAVLQAWMDSPGHRENILSAGFTAIGIAVQSGQYKNHDTWLAVQTFALPAAACPAPDENQQKLFISQKDALATLTSQLETSSELLDSQDEEFKKLQATIESLVEAGNEKIKQGNSLVKQGNKLIKQGESEAAKKLQEKGLRWQKEGQALVMSATEKQKQLTQLTEERQQTVLSHNKTVAEYNKLSETIKLLAKRYNKQVRDFNACVAKFA